ncbi:hypothetical protein D3C78_1890110 [compost metagenome]
MAGPIRAAVATLLSSRARAVWVVLMVISGFTVFIGSGVGAFNSRTIASHWQMGP